MKPFLALVAGFVVSLGMFAGGLAFATYLLTAEPVQLPDPGQDVAKLWTDEPRRVTTPAQDLERLPAPAVPPAPEPPAEERTARGSTSATGDLAPEDETIITGAAQDDPGLHVQDDPGLPVQDDPGQHREQPMPTQELSEAHLEWCADRYRSYRPRDDSYTPYSGGRRRCVSPYSEGNEAEAEGVPPPVSDSIIHAESLNSSSLSVEWVSADPQGSGLVSSEHAAYCFSRYRSYRPEDNTYQPYGGGPRRQCR